jgi:Iap family predicted aminopeptidase
MHYNLPLHFIVLQLHNITYYIIICLQLKSITIMVDLWRGTFKNILECFKMSFYEKNYKMTMIFHLYISSLNCAGTMSFDR